MQLVLNDGNVISIPLDDRVLEAWHLQYDRALRAGGAGRLSERFAHCFANSLADCLDSDLQPPTAAQVQYATTIARELAMSLPYEVLRFRGEMTDFLTKFSEAYRERRRAY